MMKIGEDDECVEECMHELKQFLSQHSIFDG